MIKESINSIGDSEEAPSPMPMEVKEIFTKNDSYTCTECQSEIEILSIDNKKITITFKCLNNDIQNNHGIKTIPIRDYINLMIKNTCLYSSCSICKKVQINDKNNLSFKFCTNCQKIICNDDICINKHTNNIVTSHHLINNNQRSIFCSIHPENKNVVFCLKCKINVCNECLKSGKHLMHRKNNLIEIKPSKEKEKIVEDYILFLKEKKQKLIKSKEKKSHELYNKNINDNKKILNDYKKYITKQKIDFKHKVDLNQKNLIYDLKKINIEYKNLIKKKINMFKIILKNLVDKFKEKINNYENIFKKNKIDKINVKYNNDRKVYLQYYNKQINDVNDLLNINEIIYNSRKKYEDNYFNNVNFSSILLCTGKSIDNFQEKYESEMESEDLLKIENENLKKEIKQIKEKYQLLLSQNEKIKKISNGNNILNNNELIKKVNNDLNSLNTEIKTKIREDLIKKTEYPKVCKNLSKSYIKNSLTNTFCVYNSSNEKIVLVYSTKSKSIIFFDIIEEMEMKEIKNAHSNFITNLRYYFDNKNIKELILSICSNNLEIKIWDPNSYKCLSKINNIFREGDLKSACIFNNDNHYYIAISNYHQINSYPIKIYNLNEKNYNILNQSNDRTNLIDIFYNTNTNIKYLIMANVNNIKSFNLNNNSFYKKYYDNDESGHLSFYINDNEDIIKLIEASRNGFLRIWNFDSAELISKIKIENTLLDICEWVESLIFIGCKDNNIILFDLVKKEIIIKLTGHINEVCCLKAISNQKYGKFLISQCKGTDQIKLWK